MSTQSPFSFLQQFVQGLNPGAAQSGNASTPLGFAPPAWALDEARRRIVLLLNHVLMQEKEAMDRLARQKGRIAHVKWRSLAIEFVATPAGLLDLADPAAPPDLVLVATQESPFELAQSFLRGDKPEVRIEGDVQLAAEVNWLTEHVRWDIEDDLSRVIGDVPAHTLGQFARRAAKTLRDFVKPPGAGANPGAPQ